MGLWGDIKSGGSWVEHNLTPFGGGQLTADEKQRQQLLRDQAAKAGGFADTGESNVGKLGQEASDRRDYLRQVAGGQVSISGEQLRQGLQQNQAAQQSMAASASPMNGPMAARTAMIQSGRLGSGLAGQQAIAGLQERRDAETALQQMIMQQRQQDMNAALQGRQNALTGYGANQPFTPQPTPGQQITNAGIAAAGMFATKSDRRAKTKIEGGDGKAKTALDGLRAYAYDYKNEKDGKGRQLGVMAQDLEKVGLGQAVIDTPDGKMVHGAKLAGANTAMLAALNRRVAKLEGGGK